MRFQSINDIAQICSKKGIKYAVLCPGSRNAPLVLAFANHPEIDCKSISDERSAGFIAMGIAQASQSPVVLVSTSGTAAYNFAPAIAEAFYQNIPLIVLTADRPKEWVNQQDGQTINQVGIYGHHVKKSYELPQDYEHSDADWYINRLINEAINTSCEFPNGPVHINIPFREPLYNESTKIHFTENIRIIENNKRSFSAGIPTEFFSKLSKYKKILIVCGQQKKDTEFLNALDHFSKVHNIPIVSDITSNTQSLANCIRFSDLFLSECGDSIKESLKPDLLITIGNSVLSKHFKKFLRKYKSTDHWHIQESGYIPDTFQSLTVQIKVNPKIFFDGLKHNIESTGFDGQKRENYLRLWEAEDSRTKQSVQRFLSNGKLSSIFLTKEILAHLPTHCSLHLSNSMSVRYANFFGLTQDQKGVEVFCNRGTSGIDGCVSTSMGHAFQKKDPHFLITGDLALFYDRNAFWHNYNYSNLRIVLLNDHGGGIFNLIDGPEGLPELNEFFITKQRLSAASLASEFGIDYLKLDGSRKLKNLLKDLNEFDGKPKLLEYETDTTTNREVFLQLKKEIRNGYN